MLDSLRAKQMATKFNMAMKPKIGENSQELTKGTDTKKREREVVDDNVIESLGHIQLDSEEVKFRISQGLLLGTIKTHSKKQEAKDRNLLKAMIKQ